MELNEQDIRRCEQSLIELVSRFDMVDAAVVSSQDGLHVASTSQSLEIEADAIAAMSASLLSLADALAGQAGKPMVDNVISEAESSTLVILHAGELVLTVIGKTGVNIGMVLTAARQTARAIGNVAHNAPSEEKEIELKGLKMLQNPEMLLERIRKEMKEKEK